MSASAREAERELREAKAALDAAEAECERLTFLYGKAINNALEHRFLSKELILDICAGRG